MPKFNQKLTNFNKNIPLATHPLWLGFTYVSLEPNLQEMELHEMLTDRQLEIQFEHCLLNPLFFSHEAHLRLAWIHLKKYGLETAIENISKQIRHFDQTYGKGEKYNVTVTIAAVHAVHHFMQRSTTETFKDFIMEFPELKTSFRELLNSHYSLDIFTDTSARNTYISPDLVAFD